jgi:polyphenol oxidase
VRAHRSPFDRVDREPPSSLFGVAAWERGAGAWRVRFLGRGVERRPEEGLGPLQPAAAALAWLEQRHTDVIVPAAPGNCGVGDALVLEASALAGVVATADCLPIAVVRGPRAVLVHAGWRGLAAGLPAKAAAQLGGGPDCEAWIGPGIGPCCYEVGEEVTEPLRRACGDDVIVSGVGGRPRLDLRRAAALALRAAGVARVSLLDHCTRCRSEWLWSHRREGGNAGRNLTLVWRDAAG